MSTRPEASELQCPICGAHQVRLLYVGNRPTEFKPFLVTTNQFGNFADLYKCGVCGFVFQPGAHEEFSGAYTDSIDLEYMQEARGRTKTANRILDAIEKYISPKRLLDVGCYTGIFLAAARARGWEVQGVELSTWAVETARTQSHLDVVQGALETANFPPAQFDLITLIDVIEHLADGAAVLKQANRLLVPGGYIYVSTPNVDSALARVMGRRWWSYRLEHIELYETRTLERSLSDNGFEIVARAVRGRDFTLGYWAGKWLTRNRFGKRIAPLLRRTGLLGKMMYLNFFDQIDILARKRETPDSDRHSKA